MRLLSRPDRSARAPSANGQKRTAPQLAAETPEELSEDELAATHAIGARFEEVSSSLEAASQLVRQLAEVEQRLFDVRNPLMAEFEAHKRDHAELIAMRLAAEQAAAKASDAERSGQSLRAQLDTVEAALDEAQHAAEANASAAEQARLEVDQLRAELTLASNRNFELEAASAQLAVRAAELQQDSESLRAQAVESDERRREADALLSRASHQNLLDAEELSTLRARVTRAGAEVARLSRIEQELTNQLAGERSRASAAEAALLQAQNDAARAIQTIEEQLAGARADVSQGFPASKPRPGR